MQHSLEWYQVISYTPIPGVCDLAPATQTPRGILREVPIACFWGGAWEIQKRYTPPIPNPVDTGQFGGVAEGPRWGMAFPIQPGDYALVGYLDPSTAVIVGFAPGWRGTPKPAYVGAQMGEPIADRFDVLLPSGAWLRSLADSTWIVTTASVDSPSVAIRLGADGSVSINAGSVSVTAETVSITAGDITLTGNVHVEGSQDINGKKVMVIGGRDSAGHTMVQDGQ